MDKCLAKLAGRESKYKYSVTCVLMQKNGAGLVTSSSQYWEKHDADLYVPVPWENNSIHCIVTIFVSDTKLKKKVNGFVLIIFFIVCAYFTCINVTFNASYIPIFHLKMNGGGKCVLIFLFFSSALFHLPLLMRVKTSFAIRKSFSLSILDLDATLVEAVEYVNGFLDGYKKVSLFIKTCLVFFIFFSVIIALTFYFVSFSR